MEAAVQAGQVTGLLFLGVMFIAPCAPLVPLAAAATALIIVGGLMMAPSADIGWNDSFEAIPAFLTVALIPLACSIADGLAFGLTAHSAPKLVRGRMAALRLALRRVTGGDSAPPAKSHPPVLSEVEARPK